MTWEVWINIKRTLIARLLTQLSAQFYQSLIIFILYKTSFKYFAKIFECLKLLFMSISIVSHSWLAQLLLIADTCPFRQNIFSLPSLPLLFALSSFSSIFSAFPYTENMCPVPFITEHKLTSLIFINSLVPEGIRFNLFNFCIKKLWIKALFIFLIPNKNGLGWYAMIHQTSLVKKSVFLTLLFERHFCSETVLCISPTPWT